MTINILYLYYDLMNLYGDSGNIKAIKYSLEKQNLEVNIDRLSLEDNIEIYRYDLIFMGSGTEKNQLIALNNLLKYKDDLKQYIENGKYVLATGNSFELFGKSIENNTALEIFNFQATYLEKRKVGDYIKNTEFGKIVAFENRGSKIINNEIPLFDAETGIRYKNLFGTYLIGPLLVRNPDFHKYFIEQLIKSKDNNFKLSEFDTKLDEKAYDNYLKTYYNETDVKN